MNPTTMPATSNDTLQRLAGVIESRRQGDPDKSYVARLFAKGQDAILKNVHAGLLLFEQDGGGVGLLQRHVLEVDALDLEHGVFLVGHGEVSLLLRNC